MIPGQDRTTAKSTQTNDMRTIRETGQASASAPAMENRTWQPVPGMPDAFVYPYIRRPDVLSCNSYLIEFPEARVLIDPGALPMQTAELRQVLAEREGGRVLPLLLFLTHCHVDHSREAPAYLNEPARPAWLALQEEGAKALAAGDVRQTAAELYGMVLRPVHAHLPLLAEADCLARKPRRLAWAEGVDVRIRTEDRDGAIRQWVDLGGRERIEIHSCAGHSPDSVCYRIGEWLFIGDLLLATKPLVAGIHGWDPRRLAQSIGQMIGLLESGQVTGCLSGHGDLFPAEKALALLRRQREKAAQFGPVAAMDPQRLFQAVDMAMELIDEAEEAFSAIAGRLLYVADRLEMLEEPDMARRCREVLDMDAVDALLHAFRNLCRALSADEILHVSFAVEATGIVEKLRKGFAPESLGAILPASMVNRAQRLLLDFIGIAHGARNLEEFMPVEMEALLEEVEAVWNASPHGEEAQDHTVEDPNRFAADLARRIGHPPPARRIPVRIGRGEGLPPMLAAAARFCDTAIQFLEWLGVAGARSIDVEPGTGAAGPFVEIRATGWRPDGSPRVRAKLQSFARRFALAGFELETGPESFRLNPSSPC